MALDKSPAEKKRRVAEDELAAYGPGQLAEVKTYHQEGRRRRRPPDQFTDAKLENTEQATEEEEEAIKADIDETQLEAPSPSTE